MNLKISQRGFEILAFAWWMLAFGVVASLAYTILGDRERAMVGEGRSRFVRAPRNATDPSIKEIQEDIQNLHRRHNQGRMGPREMRFKKQITVGRSKKRFIQNHGKTPDSRDHRKLKGRKDLVAIDFGSGSVLN